MKRTAFYLMLTAASLCPTLAQKVKPFQHLDVSVNAGSTGIGIDLGTPIAEWMGVRAGFTYMPHFHHHMNFDVGLYDNKGISKKEQQEKFNKLAERIEQITGYKVDEHIGMIGEPVFNQFKFMMDFYPLRHNRHWHITAGFFLGKRRIAKAYNRMEDMTSLIGVNIYNNLYDKIIGGEPITIGERSVYLNPKAVQQYGRMAVYMGDYTHDITYGHDTYYAEDVICDANFTYLKPEAVGKDETELTENDYYKVDEVMHHAGDVEHRAGEVIHKAGDPYMMTPDNNGMATAQMLVNNFRPYVGIGYDGRIIKGDDRYHIGFDAGIMMWGGTPSVITHDGTDLTHDVTNVPGKVGDYVSIVKKFKVYPVVSLRLTRRF